MKKYFSIGALALFSVLCLSVTLSSCDKDEKGADALVGTWESEDHPECRDIFTFLSDGSGFYSEECETGKDPYTWSMTGDILTIVWVSDEYVDKLKFEVKGDKAYLSDPDNDDNKIFVYNRVK